MSAAAERLYRAARLAGALALAAWAGGALLRCGSAWHRGLELALFTGCHVTLLRAWPLAALLLAGAGLLALIGLAINPLRRGARLALRLGLLCLAAPLLMGLFLLSYFAMLIDRPAFLSALAGAVLALAARRLLVDRARTLSRLSLIAALTAIAIIGIVAYQLGRGIAAGWLYGPPALLHWLLAIHLAPPAACVIFAIVAGWPTRDREPSATWRMVRPLALLLLIAIMALVPWVCDNLAAAVQVRDARGPVWPGVRRILDRPDGFWIEAEPAGGLLATFNRTGVISRIDPQQGELQLAQIPGGHLQQFVAEAENDTLYVANHTRPGAEVVLLERLSLRPLAVLDTGCPKTSELALDSERNRLFASCEDRPALSVFDLRTLQRTHTLRLSQREGQYAVRVGPGRLPWVWTADAFAGRLHRLDRIDLTEQGSALTGFVAFAALPDPERRLIWVSLPLRGQVLGIDMNTLRASRVLQAGAGVRFLALHPRLPMLFAGDYFSGTLRALDIQSGKTLFAIRLGPLLRGLCVSPNGDKLYALSMFGAFELDLTQGAAKL